MMKKFLKPLLILSSITSILFVTGCNNGNNSSTQDEAKNAFTLNESDKEITYGDSYKLTASFSNGLVDEITWTSTNDSVVTVNENGLVYAKNLGEAYVVAESKDCSQTCKFTVTFGENLPDLIIHNVEDGTAYIAKGQNFAINAKVNFKDTLYDVLCNAYGYDESIISFENGYLKGKALGSTAITFSAEWNGIDAKYLEKTIMVNVVDDVSFYSNVTIGSETLITNSIELSSVASWCGKNYNTAALIEPVIYINGQYHLASFEIDQSGIVVSSGNRIVAKKPGTSIISLYYDDSTTGKRYSSSIKVIVTCPIETFNGETLFISSEEQFPVDVYFGTGAHIVSATQDGKTLNVHDDYIDGLEQKGADSKPIQIITDHGGYVFNSVFIYTKKITKDNIVDTFMLSGSDVISGYYLLDEDIDVQVDFTKQKYSNASSYFNGTLDGQGHSIKALVGQNGIFGGLGDGALIKDLKLELAFANTSASASYCGIANNNETFIKNDWSVSLNNLYIKTTNFTPNCHVLFEYRPNNLTMINNYIEIGGAIDFVEFKDVSQNYAALFRYDVTPLTGPANQYYGAMRNNYVVTGQFMPIANGDFQGMKGRYVSYAKNDEIYLTQGDEVSMTHSVDRPDQSRYRIVYPGKTATEEQKKLYGFIDVESLVTTGVIPSLDTPMAALYSSNYSDGGILRFNSRSDISISSVGSWEI